MQFPIQINFYCSLSNDSELQLPPSFQESFLKKITGFFPLQGGQSGGTTQNGQAIVFSPSNLKMHFYLQLFCPPKNRTCFEIKFSSPQGTSYGGSSQSQYGQVIYFITSFPLTVNLKHCFLLSLLTRIYFKTATFFLYRVDRVGHMVATPSMDR